MAANAEDYEYLFDPQQQDKLRRALRGASLMAATNIPQRCDAAVLKKIAQKSAEIRRVRLWKRLVYSGAAVVLMLLSLAIVLGIGMPGGSSYPDIVDAYALALKIELGQSIRSQDDFNNDGQIDFRDVEAMARQAVSVSPGAGGKGA